MSEARSTMIRPDDTTKESPVRIAEVKVEVKFDLEGFRAAMTKLAEGQEWTRRRHVAALAETFVEYHVSPVPDMDEALREKMQEAMGHGLLALKGGGTGVVADTPEEAHAKASVQRAEVEAADAAGLEQ